VDTQRTYVRIGSHVKHALPPYSDTSTPGHHTTIVEETMMAVISRAKLRVRLLHAREGASMHFIFRYQLRSLLPGRRRNASVLSASSRSN
jgi:hypothetical protein